MVGVAAPGRARGVGVAYRPLRMVPSLTFAAADLPPVVRDLLIVLACAGLVAALLGRLRMSAIPGYLIAGAAIGPSVLGLVGDAADVEALGELAVVLLMFGIGLHLDTGSMKRGALPTLAVGVASVLATVAAATPIIRLFGISWAGSVAVAMGLAMSSTAVVIRDMQTRREMTRAHGRLAVGVLIVQDLLVIAVLALLPTLAPQGAAGAGAGAVDAAAAAGAGEAAGDIAMGLGPSVWGQTLRVLVVMLLLGLGRLLLPRAMLWLSRNTPPEVVLVGVAAVALGAAVGAGKLGFSGALGSFLAGFLLARTPLKYQLSGQLVPLRDLFLSVFFTTVGMRLDVGLALQSWYAVLAGLVLLLGVKTAAVAAAAWACGAVPAVAVRTGLYLAQAGEFSLVVLASAVSLGLLSAGQGSVVIGVVVASLLVTPVLMFLGGRAAEALGQRHAAPWIERAMFADPPASGAGGAPSSQAGGHAAAHGEAAARDDATPRVVVAGYGPVGRAVADRLEEEGIPFTIIEMNTATVKRQHQLGRSIVFGDVANPEVLESAGVPHAAGVILTVPDEEAVLRACRVIRAMSPRVYIAARAQALSRGLMARELGADHVTIEEVATAEAMARDAIAKLRVRMSKNAAEGKA